MSVHLKRTSNAQVRDRLGLPYIACICLLVFQSGCLDTHAKRRAISKEVLKIAGEAKSPGQSQKSIENLLRIARSSYSFGATQAVVALGTLGETARPAVPEIAELMNSSNGTVAREAARSLGKLGVVSELAISDLERQVVSGHPWVNFFAAEALGEIGKPAKSSLPILRVKYEEVSAANRRIGKGYDIFEQALKKAIIKLNEP